MTDTPDHIRELQLKLWLAKAPEERLLQFLTENDAMWKAIKEAKAHMKLQKENENSGKK